MNQHTDVIIVGGGVIGCAIAYFLRKEQIEVLVIERDAIGSHASGAAAGLLAPLGPLSGPGPFADRLLAGFHLLPTLLAELEEVSGISIHFSRPDALRVVRHPRRIAHLQKRFRQWQPLGLPIFWLTGEQAREREPHLAPDICAAVSAPDVAHLSAPHLVQAFAQAARRLGAHVVLQEEVIELLTKKTTIIGVRTRTGEIYRSQQVILAAGAWSAAWAAQPGIPLPLRPLAGQLATFPALTPSLRHLIFVVNAPRSKQIWPSNMKHCPQS
ncbi:MAG TPA: FAD-dependent oxidoreductase [Ktedonobacteraceae bacterium]|nr:FAD-dependent oxidoreductase [Ktedonobacteraceae bacterium]